MNQQSFEKALTYFQRAHAADPKSLQPRLNQGLALLNMQKVEQALTLLMEVVKRDPKSARAWYNLGLLYKSKGDFGSALTAFQKASEFAPEDPDAHYFVGLAQAQLGVNDAAVKAFQRAIDLFPFHASAEFGIARAYQKLNQSEEARTHLARFQHLTQTKIGSPITLAYGEQGSLSLVATMGTATRQPGPAVSVKFSDANRAFGLSENISSGAGACVLDVDGDGGLDLFLNGPPHGNFSLLKYQRNGRFENVSTAVSMPLKRETTACAAADFDNDSKTDLAVAHEEGIALYRNEGGKFVDVTERVGLSTKWKSEGMLWVDYDHDGDADLLVTVANKEATSGSQLWRNNGNSTFTEVTAEVGVILQQPGVAAIASDVNNDRAVDVIAMRSSGLPILFTNPREGRWPTAGPWPDAAVNANSAASLDFDKDGWMDLALTVDAAPGLVLLRNVNGKEFERIELPDTQWQSGSSVIALDYDNDGFVDLAATGSHEKGKTGIRLLRNGGSDSFQDVTTRTALDGVSLQSKAFLTAADLDVDGDTDLLVSQHNGRPLFLRNDGGNRNNSLRISLKGLADNKSALGTKVEVFAGDLWQKWEVHSGGGPGQSSTQIIAGLGNRTQVDVVRLLWPTGVIQDEIEVGLGKTKAVQIVEIDRRGSSCPVLFAWDGTRYQFISDMIGAGVIGHWVGPGEKNVPDPTEYLKVDGDIVKLRDGRLSFRFMEPMEEVVYLDQIRLFAVDHPKGSDVNPNEYFASNPPFPEFKVVSSDKRQTRLPAGAWDDKARDVLKHLLKRDHDYVAGFKLLPFAGYTEPHFLELDLGEPYANGTLRLLMHGFIEYFSATSMYAADQAGLKPVSPYVEAQDATGKWVRLVDDIGFPAGLPRTMVVDLTGKLPLKTTRIRIGTNLQIYWDEILIDRTEGHVETRVHDVPLFSSRLVFHGYPRDVERQTNARGDHYYVYEDVSGSGPFSRHSGAYTRLGKVDELLTAVDDRYVVFGSGDAVELEFDPASLPSLPAGWVRDYFFFAHGYEKDMDFYAAEGLTVEPLPHSDMKVFPYKPGAFLKQEGSTEYFLEYNDRFYSGNPAGLRSRYRFER